MKAHMRLAAALLVLSVAPGCANFTGNLLGEPTPYQPFNGSMWSTRKYGGYSETRLGQDIYRVSFTGDTMTPPVVATDYALLRSADLSLEQGFPYFAIINGADAVQVGQVTTPSTTSVTGYEQRGNTLYERRTTRPGTTYTTATPSSSNTVVMYKNRPADKNLFVYNAREIYDQLTRKYGVKPAH